MLLTTLRCGTVVLAIFIAAVCAQETQISPTPSNGLIVGSRLVRFSGFFYPADGRAPAAVESAMVSIYADETGGTALWHDTQNVSLDRDGRYSVLVGSTQGAGLPVELFASGKARWLGVQFNRPGEVEQARVLMSSVPYALKAGDAGTLGGLPPSAFVLASSVDSSASLAINGSSVDLYKTTSVDPRATSGTSGSIAEFTNATDLGNSTLVDNGGKIGLGTSAPSDLMHVKFTNTDGGFAGYAVQNLGNTNTSYSGMLFFDQNGALGQFQGFNNVTHEYRINNIASTPSINFMLNGTSRFFVSSSGNIGVGTTNPKTTLQVSSGDVLVSP